MKRITCLDCARKHLTQAKILRSEMFMGYPEHWEFSFEHMEKAEEKIWEAHDKYWDSMGHMSEASDELVVNHPVIANNIRDERLKFQDNPNYTPDFDGLRRQVTLLEE